MCEIAVNIRFNMTGIQNQAGSEDDFPNLMETGKYVVFLIVARNSSKQEIAFGKSIMCKIEISLMGYGV